MNKFPVDKPFYAVGIPFYAVHMPFFRIYPFLSVITPPVLSITQRQFCMCGMGCFPLVTEYLDNVYFPIRY